MQGCLFLNLLEAVKCAKRSRAHFTASSKFRNKHPLSNDREGEVHGLQCVCKGSKLWSEHSEWVVMGL